MSDNTELFDALSTAYAHARELAQRVSDLARLLRAQQGVLLQRGMNLSPASLESLRALERQLETFAGQALSLHTELRQLQALASSMALINALLDPPEVLARVMDTVIELTGAERGFIVLRSPATGELEFAAARGIDREQLSRADFTISSTIVNQVASTGLPELTNNASSDPRYQAQESVIGFALRSIIAVPLKVQGEIIGVVYCDNRFLSGVFGQRELDVLAAFANQAAVAIQNARLYEAARARLAEVKATSELMTNIFESVASGILTLDLSGAVSSCNAAAAAILGCQPDAAVGAPLADLLPTSANGALAACLARVRETGAVEHHRLEVAAPDGPRLWKLVVSPLRGADGAAQGVVIVLDDLTESARREAQLAEVRRYLPVALVDNLRRISISEANGQGRVISALFADVRGFTSFSERLEPETLMRIINHYLSLASDAINLYDGLVEKYVGDAVSGLFNTPFNPQQDHAVRAVQAALNMMYDLYALHELLPPEQRLFYGVGIHSGPAVLGNVGSPERQEYAAIGEAVEVSRVLQENARGGDIVISAATHALVADYFVCEAFTPERVRERRDLTVAYRVLRRQKRAAPFFAEM
ncbi:MAG: GAF domain-containing protein [Aggregatilineales bacterium]